MANDDDDDSLPPLGENTDKFLDQAKKGQARNFLMVCKGNKLKYLAVRKKPIKKNELNEAKKAGYKGEGYFGVITGKGMELVFNLAIADGYTAEPVKDKILKDFLEEKADFKCKPTIVIVATLPAVPFDDEDLKNPLIARFLGLDVLITQVLDVNPEAEAELGKTTSEIRLLLQDGDFETAEPRINTFETRLQELLNGVVPNASSPNAPTPTVDNETLKKKLQEALKELVPQLKQAVEAQPARKAELLGPVAQIKQQVEQGQFDEAKRGLLAVGKLLKEGFSQTASPSASTPSPESPAGATADKLMAAFSKLSPSIKQAVANNPSRKEEILEPVAAFQAHVKANELSQAKDCLQQMMSLLKTLTVESPAISIMKLGKVRLEWNTVRLSAVQEIARLKELLIGEYQFDEDEQATLIAAQQTLDSKIASLNEELGDRLDDVLTADPADRPERAATAKEILQRFIVFINSDEILSVIDGNEYAPEMTVAEPMRLKLQEIAVALG